MPPHPPNEKAKDLSPLWPSKIWDWNLRARENTLPLSHPLRDIKKKKKLNPEFPNRHYHKNVLSTTGISIG